MMDIFTLVATTYNSSGPAWEYFLNGDLFNASLEVFKMALGSWIYVIGIGFLALLTAVKTQTIAIPCIITVAVGLMLYNFLPTEAFAIISIIATIFLGVSLFAFYTKMTQAGD